MGRFCWLEQHERRQLAHNRPPASVRVGPRSFRRGQSVDNVRTDADTAADRRGQTQTDTADTDGGQTRQTRFGQTRRTRRTDTADM